MNEKKLKHELERSLSWATDGGFSREKENTQTEIQRRLIDAHQRVHGSNLRAASIAVGSAFERGKRYAKR